MFEGVEGSGFRLAGWRPVEGDRPGRGRAARVLSALLLATALLSACTPLDDLMAGIFGRSMRDQPSFDPYENPLPAPEGSIPFAAGNFPVRAGAIQIGQPAGLREVPPPFTQADLLNESPVVVNLPNPVPPDAASIQRGETLFLRFCAPCHGPDGSGVAGYIVPAGYPPFPLVSDRAKGFTDGYIYGMIRVGRGLMPSYGHRISHFDRWNVVNYLRVLQGLTPSPDRGMGGVSDPGSGSGSAGEASH